MRVKRNARTACCIVLQTHHPEVCGCYLYEQKISFAVFEEKKGWFSHFVLDTPGGGGSPPRPPPPFPPSDTSLGLSLTVPWSAMAHQLPAVFGHPKPAADCQLLFIGQPLLTVTRQPPSVTIQYHLVDCRQDKFRPRLQPFLLPYAAGLLWVRSGQVFVGGGGVVCGPRGSDWVLSLDRQPMRAELLVSWIRLGFSIAGYMCPQYLRDQRYSEKSEVHSFGVVLCELISGLLAQRLDITALLKEDELEADARPGPWPDALVQGLLRLAKNCTKALPDRRPQMLTVMRCVQCAPCAFSCARVPLWYVHSAAQCNSPSSEAPKGWEPKEGSARLLQNSAPPPKKKTLRVCSV